MITWHHIHLDCFQWYNYASEEKTSKRRYWPYALLQRLSISSLYPADAIWLSLFNSSSKPT